MRRSRDKFGATVTRIGVTIGCSLKPCRQLIRFQNPPIAAAYHATEVDCQGRSGEITGGGLEALTGNDRLPHNFLMRKSARADSTQPFGMVVGYTRVSTREQAESGAGLDAQAAAIRADVAQRRWNLVRICTDAGVSGTSMKGRLGLAEALAAIERGDADTLMVAKLDRLSRSLVDFAALMASARRDGWNLVALDLGIDLSTPSGEFLASMMASAARWEARIISARTIDALAARRASGVILGRPAVLPASLGSRVRAERSAGLTFQAIADVLNAEAVPTAHGGKRWYPSTVRGAARVGAELPNSDRLPVG
jgi:DNA invertase Pin-like site-specific DNA recombinase